MKCPSSELPPRISRLPVDRRGYPVPWFVAWIDGDPDFRVIGEGKIIDAIRFQKCWVCGQKLGAYKAFVIGPMCSINRISSEPPSHKDCAIYASTHCPFLTEPREKRNEKGLGELEAQEPAGVMLKHNPGVALVWITKKHRNLRFKKGILFDVGNPVEVLWYCKGRPAKRVEVLESIEKGYPILQQSAEKDGPKALEELVKRRAIAEKLIPEV